MAIDNLELLRCSRCIKLDYRVYITWQTKLPTYITSSTSSPHLHSHLHHQTQHYHTQVLLLLLLFIMKFSLPITALALSASTLAAPTTLATRATTGVYLCNDRNFSGYCVHIPSAPSQCVPLAADLNDKVSSAGPDQGSFCYFFV